MYKDALVFTPYISLLSQYPSLFKMARATVVTAAQRDSILAIGEAVAATHYAERAKQRAFLDEKTVALVINVLVIFHDTWTH